MIANTSLSDYLDILDLSLNTQISIYKSSIKSVVYKGVIGDFISTDVFFDSRYSIVKKLNICWDRQLLEIVIC